jgi:hypothetical protein
VGVRATLVAGVGFEPTTSGPADEIGQLEKCQPDVGLIARDEEGKKEVVAGVGFEPTTSGL